MDNVNHVFVVMPCLNEERTIADVCRSLGFDRINKNILECTSLIVVDNGSTDGSKRILLEMQEGYGHIRFYIVDEPERGYVPARHRGVLLAREIASVHGWDLKTVWILQTDADTIYKEGYVSTMLEHIQVCAPHIFLEACVGYKPSSMKNLSQYFALCQFVDSAIAPHLPLLSTDEIIVDDKVCGYNLEMYFRWGGHKRAYLADGDELHAESTRLYMAAFAQGAVKSSIATALGYHSVRKIEQNPLRHFATAGFPFPSSYPLEADLLPHLVQKFNSNDKLTEQLLPYVTQRVLNELALFVVLPLHVFRTADRELSSASTELVAFIEQHLIKRSLLELASSPATLLTDAFNFTAQYRATVLSYLL